MDMVIATCLNPKDRFNVVCFEWQGERYCCLRQLCSLMGLDYEKAKRITLARIPVQLSPAVMLDGPDKLETCGVLLKDMPKWLGFRWWFARVDAWEHLELLFHGRDVVRATTPRALQRKRVRRRRRVHITHEMVGKLYKARSEGLSFVQAGRLINMSGGTTCLICKGLYAERLSEAACALWEETFGKGDPHPNAQPDPDASESLTQEPAPVVVEWTHIWRIHQVINGGGSMEDAARITELPLEVVTAVVSGAYWPKSEAKPPIWDDLFGQ